MNWKRAKPHLQHLAFSIGVGVLGWTWTHPPFVQEWLRGVALGVGLFAFTALAQLIGRRFGTPPDAL